MIRAIASTILLLLAATPTLADSGTSDARALFAQERAAAGGNAWERIAEIVERGTFRSGGLSGPYITYTDTRRGWSKSAVHYAGTMQGSGYDARGTWSQQDGLVEPLEDAASVASARASAYIARNGWWNPDRDPATFAFEGRQEQSGRIYDVVRVVPAGGDVLVVWLDASNHRIAKIVQTNASNVVTTTSYSNYRSTGGVFYPFATMQSNGNPQYDQHTSVTEVAFMPAARLADFTRPPNQRSASISGSSQTVIPFELDSAGKGHIVVAGSVNGSRPLRLIFDTGGSNVLSPETAREVGLRGQGAVAAGGAGEQQVSVQIASGAKLTLGTATFRNQQFGIFPLPPSLTGITSRYRIDGVVGYEVLKNFVVSIDYVHRQLTLSDPRTFRYAGGGTAVRFSSATVPVIPVSFDGVTGSFMVDTGNAFYNTISESFVSAHSLTPRLPGSIVVQSSGNIGGSIRPRLTRVDSIGIGPYAIDRPVFAVTETSKGALAGTAFAGNLGEPILSRFDLTFDYDRSVIYFKPNADFHKPFVGSLDGMSVYKPDATQLSVAFVNPGSPAADAGIVAGDRIVSIDGASGNLGPADLSAAEVAGASLQLRLMRNGVLQNVTLVPREVVP